MKRLEIEKITIEELQNIISEEINKVVEEIKNQFQAKSEYLTRAQVKDLLHVSLGTLNELTKTGQLQGYKIGGRVLYKSSEIDQALQIMESRKI